MVISLLALIAATVICYSVFPRVCDAQRQESGATILGMLVGIFVLFFAATQILYSVNDIPRELLRKYSLLTGESLSLVAYFLIAILICGLIVVLFPITNAQYLLFSALVLALLIITCYFFWFTKRITPKEILRQITLRTDRALAKINRLEKRSGKDFSDFHEFIRNSKGRCRYDEGYAIYDTLSDDKEPSFTLLAKEQRDIMMGKIDVQEIEKRLSQITSDPHVKIIFEVEPTQPIPKKDPYNNMLHNYRLLTIAFEEIEGDKKKGLEKAQKDFLEKLKTTKRETTVTEETEDILVKVRGILREFGTGLEDCFEQEDHRKWPNEVENALEDLKTMFVYNLKNEQVVDPLSLALETIIVDQFFALKPDVFLHVRHDLLRKIFVMVKEINKVSVRKDDVRFFGNVLRLFYRLAPTAAQYSNQLIYDEILRAMRQFHSLFVTTAPHAHSFLAEILVLSISELTTSFPRGHFETEDDLDELDRFYNTIFEKGVDTAFEVVKDYLNWYNEDKLHHPIYLKKQMQFLIDFMPFYKDRPEDYFSEPLEFFKMKREMAESSPTEENSKFKLAIKKAEIVKDLKARLQRRIMQLAIYAVALYKEKELDADVIWKIALPAARSSCYEHGLQSFFTRLFNDYGFDRDTQDFFQWRDIHPAGAHELRGFNLNIFWIIFNVYLGRGEFFPTEAEEFRKIGLLNSFPFIDDNLWAQVLNINPKEFSERKNRYHEFAKGIKPIRGEAG
jgi:hypothetical protein